MNAASQHAVYGPVTVGALVLLVLCTVPSDGEALRIRLRARGDISVEAYRHRGVVVVRGRLNDSRGRPVADASVAVRIRPLGASGSGEVAGTITTAGAVDTDELSGTGQTSSHGRFEVKFAAAGALHKVRRMTLHASFSGNTEVARATVEATVDIDKPQAKLEVEVKPALLTTDLEALDVAVFAAVIDNPLPAQVVKLKIDGIARAALRTGDDGWALQRLSTAELMPLGPHTLRFELAETEEYNAASATVHVEVHAATAITMRLWPGTKERPCLREHVCLRGAVGTIEPTLGETPAAEAAVSLHANKLRLMTLTADRAGRFEVRLSGERLRRIFGTGDIGIVAEGRAATAFSDAGWSEVLVVRAPLPETVSQWFYAALLAAIALGLVWRRAADRWRERNLARELADVSAGLPIRSVRRVGSGGIEARCLRGVVLGGETGKPTEALVTLLELPGPLDAEQQPARHEQLAPSGAFRFDDIVDGRWLLRVEVAEHEPLQLRLAIPHDGTYDGCELLPRSHRAVVRSAFADVVRVRTGRDVDWLKETPKMAEPRWMQRARRGHAAIRKAVQQVDRALYGSPVSAERVEKARGALRDAEEESA